jgi:ADP-ribose pyrophosphatase YjhB (NUDIX family)
MIDTIQLQHHIQKHIVSILMKCQTAKFSELRPPKTDTNLFSYHLKCLLRDGFIEKLDREYSLSKKGLMYVDRLSNQTGLVRHQPKIISMLLVQNSEGEVLLMKRRKQPFTDTWTLPYGKVHNEDETILKAAQREASDKLNFAPDSLRHVGDCYIRVRMDNELFSSTLAHIFRFETDNIQADDTRIWVRPLNLPRYLLAPAVEQIVARSFFGDDHFFAEFTTDWQLRQAASDPSVDTASAHA